jgi:iron complex outermembrane recepter protein
MQPSPRQSAKFASRRMEGTFVALTSRVPAMKVSKQVQDSVIRTLYAGAPLAVLCCVTQVATAQQATAPADDTPIPVPKVSVESATPEPPPDGSAAAGYRVKDQSATGTFWGNQTLQDTPYSVTVVPSALMENLQVYDEQTALKYIPGIQTGNNAQNMTGTSSFTIRGFNFAGSSTSSGQTFEGMQNQGGFEFTPIEDKDRLEVISGLNGFMYGIGNVGGEINAVLKRPTDTALYQLDLGDNAGANFFAHADLGGPLPIPGLPDGLFGYRLNLLEQTGDTSYNGQSVDRQLASIAFDVHPLDNLLLQFNGSSAYYNLHGPTPFYILSAKTGFPALSQYPDPPDPSTLKTYGAAEHFDRTQMGGVKLTWKPDEIFTLRSQYSFTNESINPDLAMYQKVYSDYTFQINPYAGGQSNDYKTHSAYTYLDTDLNWGGVQNKFTVGWNGFYQTTQFFGDRLTWPTQTYPYGDFYNQTASNFTLPAPVAAAAPTYVSGHVWASNFMIGDAVTYSDFILLLGGNYATWSSNSFNTTGLETNRYSSNATTPAVALTYKVLPWVSAYASYQESLQPGSVVTSSGNMIFTNNGAVIPPYEGKQYEVGAKATLGAGLLATIAAYTIDKSNQYDQLNPDGTYTAVVGGSVRDKGVEITVSGKVISDLTLFGGATYEDPRVHNNPVQPWQNGQLEQDASPISAKLYSEYILPFIDSAPWIRNFILTAGVSFTGPYHGNIRSSYTTAPDSFSGYTVGDVGFRYATAIGSHPVMVRFTVDNVANTGYWAATGLEGPPRTFLGSVQAKW